MEYSVPTWSLFTGPVTIVDLDVAKENHDLVREFIKGLLMLTMKSHMRL